MDTQFSSAIHTLILISEAAPPMNSEEIAGSVGTNASYIRKLTARLKKAGIIESRQGISGFSLVEDSKSLSLFDIYKAVTGNDKVHIFDFHQNPNDACIVGKNIKPVLGDMFRSMEVEIERMLKSTTLFCCMEDMKKRIKADELKSEKER